VPAAGDDLLGPVRPPEQPPAPGRWRLRFEPRNLAFTDGLDRWVFGGSFRRAAQGGGHGHRDAPGSHWHDYSCSAQNGSAALASAVPRPHGSAFFRQAIFADDYRGTTVVFGGEIRTEDVAEHAGITLLVAGDPPLRPGHDGDVDGEANGCHVQTITGSHGWTRHKVTAAVPDDAQIIRFGITLTGPGRVELRNVELTRSP
jgi:hypothetical protein